MPCWLMSVLVLAPAAHGAIFLHGFLPFWTALMGWLIVQEHMTRDRWLGLKLYCFWYWCNGGCRNPKHLIAILVGVM